MTHDKTIDLDAFEDPDKQATVFETIAAESRIRAAGPALLRLAREQRARLEIAEEELERARLQLHTARDAHANADDALERAEAQGKRHRDELASLKAMRELPPTPNQDNWTEEARECVESLSSCYAHSIVELASLREELEEARGRIDRALEAIRDEDDPDAPGRPWLVDNVQALLSRPAPADGEPKEGGA